MRSIAEQALRVLASGNPATEHDAGISAYGRRFGGWLSLSISTSLEDACTSFSFATAARWPGEQHPIRIRPSAPVEAFIGLDVLAAGYVDKVDTSYDAASHTISVSGRSKVADLVDCHATPGVYEGIKLEVLAARLAAPYGVTVRADVDTGAVVRRVRVRERETVYSVLERMARARALLLTDDPTGALVFTRAGLGRAHTALVLGENVLSCSSSFDASKRYSEYRCKGQRAGDDLDFGDVLDTEATVEDDGIDRYRLLYVEPEPLADAARCKVRATWEAANRYGQSVQLSYTVVGWRQGNGALWTKGDLVQVVDEFTGLDDELVIVATTFDLSEAGTTTTLQLVPPEAYEPLPPHKPRPRRRRGGKKVGAFGELEDGVKVPARPAGGS